MIEPRKGRWLQLLLITCVAAAAIYARTAISPLQETMRGALALSDNQMALLQGPALAIAVMITAAPVGMMIDRWSRVRALCLFGALATLGNLLTAWADAFYVLFMARSLVGITAPATAIAGASLIADMYAPAQRGRANMVMAIGQIGGMSAAFALGGAVLTYHVAEVDGWRWTLCWMSIPIALIVLMSLGLREPPRTNVSAERLSAGSALVELWRYRAVVAPLLAGVAMVATADGAALVWVAPTLARRFALPADEIGAIMATVLLASGILGPAAGGLLSDACQRTGGPRRTMAGLIALASLSIAAGLFAVAPSVVSAMIPLALFLTMGGAINVSVTTLLTVVIPNELRGLCLAMLWALGVLFGLGLAPMMVSLVARTLGGPARIGDALAAVCVVTSVFGTAVFVSALRHLRPAHAS